MPPTFGKCPYCKELLTSLDASKIPVNVSFAKTVHGVAFLCPSCHTVLSAGVDPAALLNDLADQLRSRS